MNGCDSFLNAMPAATFKAKSLTELLSIRARDQPDDPFVYTADATAGSDIVLNSLTYVRFLDVYRVEVNLVA